MFGNRRDPLGADHFDLPQNRGHCSASQAVRSARYDTHRHVTARIPFARVSMTMPSRRDERFRGKLTFLGGSTVAGLSLDGGKVQRL